ncbi:phage tail tip lysozyme [bacterium]|nr:phage tail tip lysozyme [bacterium]
MATDSTNNFCAKINNDLDPSGLNLSVYCKENGNLLLLDPSGAINNNSVTQEDLVIYATLKAKVRNKSLVIDNQVENITSINFIKGKDAAPGQAPVGTSFLTTNWTDLGSVDSQLGEDLETFGMTNIDINFNSGFIPIITIDFIDIRGATLFEQGSCSPYGAFFHQPYPIFELTIKGYYGQPVKYTLHVNKFTTSFDPGTGNYKSRGEFIGYSYAFLSDIVLGYVMAAPYMTEYDSDGKLNQIYEKYLKYYEELGYNNGTNKFNPKTNVDGRPFTIFNYVKKIEGLLGQGNTDEGAIADIQNSTELAEIDQLDDVEQTISDIQENLKDFSEKWVEQGGEVSGNIHTYGNSKNDVSTPISESILTLFNEYFSNTGFVGVRVEIFNEFVDEVKSQTKLTKLELADFQITSSDNSFYLLDLTAFINKIESKTQEVTSSLNLKREEFKKLANEKVKGSIGFVPTVRSFFTVLLANTELFLELLKNASYDAEVYHNENPNQKLNFKSLRNSNAPSVGGPDGVVWAWPTYVETKKIGGKDVETDVETYPGNNPKFANWPEVKFVESFLKALQEMQKDISEEEDETEEDLTIDPYDDIPGRDNYIPINAMESPAGARDCNNSYYNINGANDVFKTLGERFIILSNFSSANSNNINTSILATARNKFYEWQFTDSGIGEHITTNFEGINENNGVSNSIDFLNNSTLTPYFSAGAYFNPPKFGGNDSGRVTSLTYGSAKNPTYKGLSGLLGYPYIDWATVSYTSLPFGVQGSAAVAGYKIRKAENGTSGAILEKIESGGEVQSFSETSDQTLSKSVDQRKVYYDESQISTTNPAGVKLNSSPVNQKITDNGNSSIFILSEPIYYTKTVIFMWAGLESKISRDEQFDQIPKEIKDRCFIVLAAGTTQDKQNTEQDLKSAFLNYYGDSGIGGPIITRSNVTTSGAQIDIENDFSDFQKIYLGYSAGGRALFNNNGVSGGKIIGLIDPSIGAGSNPLNANSRMVWGSPGMIGVFSESKYEILQNTIKQNQGKSEKVNGLNHFEAIKKWFELYQSDILDDIENVLDTIVTVTPTPTPTAKNTTNNSTSNKKNTTINFEGIKISTPQQKNWEWLGRVEAHNFYNSITNVPLIGQIINDSNVTEDLFKKVIKSLEIPKEDIFEDSFNEIYRYNKPLTLNRVSRKGGGSVTILPDIHQMEGKDLVRLNKFNDTHGAGYNPITEDTSIVNGPLNIMELWYNNSSGRKGFGLKEDSTFIKAIDLSDYLNTRYGSEIAANREIKGKVKETNEKGDSERRLVIVKAQSYGATTLTNKRYETTTVDEESTIVRNVGTFADTGIYFSPMGPIVDGARYSIDNSTDQLGTPMLSKHTQDAPTVMDKFMTVDIYPDYEWYYKGWIKLTPQKTYASDWNFRYSRDIYEFNNPKNKTLKRDTIPYRSWHALDLTSIPNLTIFNKNEATYNSQQVKTLSFRSLTTSPPPTTGENFSYFPYSTSYGEKILTPKNAENPVSDFENDDNNLVDIAMNNTFESISFDVASTTSIDGLPQVEIQDFTNEIISEATLAAAQIESEQASQAEAARQAELSQIRLEASDKTSALDLQEAYPVPLPGVYSIVNSRRLSLQGNDVSPKDSGNANWLNVGGSITETPWWRHNLPAEETGSLTDKGYYSFCGALVMNQTDDDESYANSGLSKKPLYLGLKNDLDSYTLSSKFFPSGVEGLNVGTGDNTLKKINDYYNGDVNEKGQKIGTKIMLTNHNENDVELQYDEVTEQTDIATNYNRTKAWKGALAYLFLSNQYHKPWTGQQSNSLRSLGPQGTLGLCSMNVPMPKHSVLMLGSVLWRMREAGLLESDSQRWNLSPTITGGLDPVCYPKLPSTINGSSARMDLDNFTTDNIDNFLELPKDESHPTNKGVRPPQISIITRWNQKDGHGNFEDDSALCFPRADEWPTPNNGMIYTYDYFSDKGVTNPFKNQYKIFTPFFAKRNLLGLRYITQNILWTTGEEQQSSFISAVQNEFDTQTANLEEYSDSAKASIPEELSNYAGNYIKEQFKDAENLLKDKATLDAYLAKERTAGSEEGFTRFTAIAHQAKTSFIRRQDYSTVSKIADNLRFLKTNLNYDDGRSSIFTKESVNYGSSTSRYSDGNVSSVALTNDGSLYTGKESLSSEYTKNKGVEILVKTWAEMETLVNEKKFTKPDGTVLEIQKIANEIPVTEETEKLIQIYNNSPSYNAITENGNLTNQNALINQNTAPVLANSLVNASQYTPPNPKSFQGIRGQINAHYYPNTDNSVDYVTGNFVETQYFLYPAIAELNGYQLPSTFGYNSSINSEFQDYDYIPAYKDAPCGPKQKCKKSFKEVYKGLNAVSKFYISSSVSQYDSYADLTDEQLDTNIYHFIGEYSRFNSGEDYVYSPTYIGFGRKFIVIPKVQETEDGTPSDEQNTQTQNLNGDIFRDLTKYGGYLRGYIPMGPEIWFMPSSVKQIFIDEFEEFVGNLNNWNGDSDFDKILQIIDPLNFPTPKQDNKIPNVFEDDLTYQTMVEEIGGFYNQAPYILALKNETNKELYGKGVETDGNGLPKVPEPLVRWLNFYQYGLGVKSAALNSSDTPTSILIREQKTPPISIGSNYGQEKKETDPPSTSDKKVGEGGEAVAESKFIYDTLFNDHYILSSSTPRTWMGEFPLKETDSGLVEAENDYFRFSKQELFSFLYGFIEELNKGTIKNDYKDKIKDKYRSELSGEAIGANQDDDIRLSIYRSLKTIYDKWISASPAGKDKEQDSLFFNPIGRDEDGDRLLMDHFSFVNRINEDIGDTALVNVDIINELFLNTTNSIYGVTSDVLDASNFNFFPLPSYVDLSAGKSLFTRKNNTPNNRQQAVLDMFRPLSEQEYFTTTLNLNGGPHFLCQYVGGYSKELELSKNKEKGCLNEQTKRFGRKQNQGDSYPLSNIEELPPDFSNESESSDGVVGFKVAFGSENQSHFLGVSLDQAEYKNTQEALVAMEKISNAAVDGGAAGFVSKGQSLYELFLNRSYSCTIEALGNPMIQPLMYFELENVPMFYGSYLIRDVKHNIRPHTMKTTFTGDRVPFATVPIVEDLISTFKIKPQQSGKKKSLKSGGSGSSGSRGKAGTGKKGNDVDLSTIPPSTNTANIRKKLNDSNFKLVQRNTENGKLLNTEFGNGSGKRFVSGEYEPLGIMLHWSAGWTSEQAFSVLRQRGNGTTYNLSYHIEISEDGVAEQFADFNRSAAHGGCDPAGKPGCKSLNKGSTPTMGVSYAGGIEGGHLTEGYPEAYVRTWEDWNEETKTTPFCPKGTKRGKFGYYECSDTGTWGTNANSSKRTKAGSVGYVFKPRAQWEALVKSILHLKVVWPSIGFLTSHHWASGKIDVGTQFPWDKLLEDLKAGGWNKSEAGADPYIITEWTDPRGIVIKANKLELNSENANSLKLPEQYAEFTDTESEDTNPNATSIKSYRESKGCKLVNIPQESKKVTSTQIGEKIKEIAPDYNAAVRAGIIANMWSESSFNLNAYTTDGADCGSYGLIQWRDFKNDNVNGRQAKFAKYCEENGLKTDSLEGQIKWLIKGELKERLKKSSEWIGAIEDNVTGAKTAAYYFATKIEICGGCNDGTLKSPPTKVVVRQNFAEDIFNGDFKY